jgi:hypothetical protein
MELALITPIGFQHQVTKKPRSTRKIFAPQSAYEVSEINSMMVGVGQVFNLPIRTSFALAHQDKFCACPSGQVKNLSYTRAPSLCFFEPSVGVGQVFNLPIRTSFALAHQDKFCACPSGQVLRLLIRTS